MTDGVDRTGELIHGMTERHVQKIDRRDRPLRRGEIMPEIVQREFSGRVFQQQNQIGNRAGAGQGESALIPPVVKAVREIAHKPAEPTVGDALVEVQVPPGLLHHDQIETAS